MTNVLANLIAAAIIYVLAAAAGLLPRDPALILSALILISLAAAMVLLLLITTNAFAGKEDILGGGMAIALGTPILTSTVVYAFRERDPAAGIVGGLIGAGLAGAGVAMLVAGRRLRRAADPSPDRDQRAGDSSPDGDQRAAEPRARP
ncbi:diguanylate cyclase [Micromonospora tulbaghiae]|uniref:diguanylate cyclase n=1 Tax=Micromonospora TaxID=1873 RepID=UPI00207CD27B|nr:diguanylate cyclase [Micromonospora sp. CPM1]MCO1614481.1 diguanylate cyclase [Micromonospora sp. CPM1]